MRLDKFLSKALRISRSEAKKRLTSGRITLNEQVVKRGTVLLKSSDQVCSNGAPISLPEKRYVLLNKPTGYICSTVDESLPSALGLLDIGHQEGLHFAGRLDADTTGLVLISDDGQWTHRITSPKFKRSKQYLVSLADNIDPQQIHQLTEGVLLKDSERLTLPAKVDLVNQTTIRLSITEGRYHQVKRMLAAVGNRVVDLHRESIGNLALDSALGLGQWRYLETQEIELF